jgi:hypothetical protein
MTDTTPLQLGGMREFDKQTKHRLATSRCIVRNNSIVNSSLMYREVVIYTHAQSSIEFQDASKYFTFFVCILFTITTMMHKFNYP